MLNSVFEYNGLNCALERDEISSYLVLYRPSADEVFQSLEYGFKKEPDGRYILRACIEDDFKQTKMIGENIAVGYFRLSNASVVHSIASYYTENHMLHCTYGQISKQEYEYLKHNFGKDKNHGMTFGEMIEWMNRHTPMPGNQKKRKAFSMHDVKKELTLLHQSSLYTYHMSAEEKEKADELCDIIDFLSDGRGISYQTASDFHVDTQSNIIGSFGKKNSGYILFMSEYNGYVIFSGHPDGQFVLDNDFKMGTIVPYARWEALKHLLILHGKYIRVPDLYREHEAVFRFDGKTWHMKWENGIRQYKFCDERYLTGYTSSGTCITIKEDEVLYDQSAPNLFAGFVLKLWDKEKEESA